MPEGPSASGRVARILTSYWGLLIAVFVGMLVSLALNWSAPIGQLLPQSSVLQSAFEDDGAPRIGPANSDVAVVVFTDYRCPACRLGDEEILRAAAADGRVVLIFRPVTVFGPQSLAAARIAIAANRQGLFLRVHRALMAAPGRLDHDGLAAAMRRARADPVQIAALDARFRRETDRLIERNRLAAFSLGFAGTPSYLVGRYRVEGAISARQFRKLLKRARAAA